MNASRPSTWRPGWMLVLFGLVVVVALGIVPARPAAAHSLDEFREISYLTFDDDQVTVEIAITPGVLLASDLLAAIDTDGDAAISESEATAYAASVVEVLTVSVDGQDLTLQMAEVEMPAYLNIQAGYGQIGITAAATLPAGMATDGATHTLVFTNLDTPTNVKYQVNAFVAQQADVSLGSQIRSDDQQSLTIDFAVGAEVQAVSIDAGDAAGPSSRMDTLLSYLERPSLAPTTLAVVLGLALVLGGLHALTPGHGKTLVAAYLVGSRGTVRHAALLGATVTFTHTISVIGIGLIALFASHLIVPEVLVPMLTVLSGLLVVVLGGRLVWRRWLVMRQPSSAGHAYPATTTGLHHHGDGRLHGHAVPATMDTRSLLALGVSGGLVPCPEALGIMILAVGLNHIILGLGMIVAFSLGLAVVLIGIGIALVRSQALINRVGQREGWVQHWLPLASALVVLILGLGMTVPALAKLPVETIPADRLLLIVGGALTGTVVGLAIVRRRHQPRLQVAAGGTALVPLEMLPPRYRDGHAVSSAPMGAAPLVFDPAGKVAWDRIWGHDDPASPFCELALAGGPPHRGTALEPDPTAIQVATAAELDAVRNEIARGIRLVSGLAVTTDVEPGWIGMICDSPEMAAWLAVAIDAENVRARQDGTRVLLPADPSFRVEAEVKNVVTAVAKTFHYWSEHAADAVLSPDCSTMGRLLR